MSLQIAAALRGGVDRLLSRTGGVLIAAYALTYVVYQASFNGALVTVYEQAGLSEAATALQPALGGPLWLQGVVVLLCLLALSYLSIVAIRTFVANTPEAFPDHAFSRGIVVALVNLVVGGIVFSILYWVGLVLLVVPGLFVLVSFLFMPIFVAEEGQNFVAALKNSWELATGNRLEIFGLMVILMAVGGAFGFVVGFGSAMVAATGGPQGLLSLLFAVVIGPITLFGLAVTTDAYTQLRDEDDEGFEGGETTTAETPSTPA